MIAASFLHRPTQSISAESTFEQDIPLSQTEPVIRRLAESVWSGSRKESRVPRTVVLKLMTSEHQILTPKPHAALSPSSCEELTNIALWLRERVALSPLQLYRLVGVGWETFGSPTMTQIRRLTNAEFLSNSHQAGDHHCHDLSFAGRE